jgi:hypothetical protein
MLASREFESQRVQYHLNLLVKTGIPLLTALEEAAVAESIPMGWIHDTAQKLAQLLVELLEAGNDVEGRYVASWLKYSNV